MPRIRFVREQREVEAPVGANLRKVARANGIDLYYRFPGIPNWVAQNVLNCHGLGICGTCGVHLIEGTAANAEPPGLRERIRVRIYDPLTPHLPAGRIGHEKEFRLSCQTIVKGDLTVVTQPYNWFGGAPLELSKIGEKNPTYDEKVKKVAPVQAKARALGIHRPVRPEEVSPPKPEKKVEAAAAPAAAAPAAAAPANEGAP
jgi:ferredoxin